MTDANNSTLRIIVRSAGIQCEINEVRQKGKQNEQDYKERYKMLTNLKKIDDVTRELQHCC